MIFKSQTVDGKYCLFALFFIAITGCVDSTLHNKDPLGSGPLEGQLQVALDTVNTDTDFTFMAQSNNGTQFIYNRNASTPTTSYRSASTSKMVTASVILRLVDKGIISLNDHPQDYLDFWPKTGNHAAIELHHLLSFTSGLKIK